MLTSRQRIQLMNGKITPSSSQPHCCEIRLLPLLQRIEQLEGRLAVEVECRQKDYNQMLRIIIRGKEHRDGQHPMITNKRSKIKEDNHKTRGLTSPDQKQTVKLALNKRRSTKLIKMSRQKTQIQEKTQHAEQPAQNDQISAVKTKTVAMQISLNRHQSELSRHQNDLIKIKELNDYLMDQLLVLFQRKKSIKVGATEKQLQSLQTVTSMIMDQNSSQQGNTLNKRNRAKVHSEQLAQINAKLAEHENVLTELIQLTRSLSTQIHIEDHTQAPPFYSYH